jgi:hypothetical protein
MMYAPSPHSGITAMQLLLHALLETGALSKEQWRQVVSHMQASADQAIGQGVNAEDFRSIARMLAVFDDEQGS